MALLLVTAASPTATDDLNAAKAFVLGVVEGVTEYLPISSTGHLLITQELLGVGDTDATEDAAESFAITIQAGAILAVVVLYFSRLRSMAAGLAGRDPEGRNVLIALAIAFVPAAAVAVMFEHSIKNRLFGAWPVITAWIVGGIAILLAARFFERRPPGTVTLAAITPGAALAIGVAQILALWPGTSRSLVTILAALALGFTMASALEFSFLLGLTTLTAATVYEAVKNGGDLVDTYGWIDPVIGFVVAFVAAALAVRWLVAYLDRHGLALFGWYRIVVGVLAIVLVATDVI
jgi:undecaprenyl-diphosphatase